MSNQIEKKNVGGRPPVLDERKRRIVLSLLANGSSQRMAAGYVGCSPCTIMRTIGRDPEFAEAVAMAEQNAEIEALQQVRRAARNERYWRAAAWLLERKNPTDFARRPHKSLSNEQVVGLFRLVAAPILEKLSDDDYYATMDRLNECARRLREEPENADVALFPPDGGDKPASDPSAGSGFATAEPSRSDCSAEWDETELDWPEEDEEDYAAPD